MNIHEMQFFRRQYSGGMRKKFIAEATVVEVSELRRFLFMRVFFV
jgi:hypothetical protein